MNATTITVRVMAHFWADGTGGETPTWARPGGRGRGWRRRLAGLPAGDVGLPVVVGLGHHRDDALHLVLERVAGAGRDQQPVPLHARVHVLEDDRRAHPGR